MNNSRPAQTDDSLTVAEALQFHFLNTPRTRPLHRSAMYRLVKSGRIAGTIQGGTVYVSKQSLAQYCEARPAQSAAPPRPSEVLRSEAAVRRLRERHGIGASRKGVSE